MPPRLSPSLRRLQTSAPVFKEYICSSCLQEARHKQTRAPKTRISFHTYDSVLTSKREPPANIRIARSGGNKRLNGSLASRTAVNAPSTVPVAYRELYQQLQALQESASSYVDLSRLQLALRSLESSNPTVRVALLGLGSNGALAARKLARALLSDPLSDEEEWERKILESIGDGRNLLLRYGEAEEDATGQPGQNPLLRTLHIPSPYLRQNNVEILVASFNANTSTASTDHEALEEAILVPSLTTPTSAGGRVGFVRYPVHKAMIVTEGVTGAVDFGRLPATLLDGKLISAALSIPLRQAAGTETGEQDATSNAVDVDLAVHSLGLFRSDRANGARFSEEWQTSQISTVADWIAAGKNQSSMNLDVQHSLTSLLTSGLASVTAAESSSTATVGSNSVPDSRRTALQSAISTWSADGHKDLQSNLDPALSDSKAWRRTVWWRLFWRIDDVTTSTSELLRQTWLNEADQRLAFLCGQIVEAGLASHEQMRQAGAIQLLDEGRKGEMEELEEKTSTESVAQLMRMPSMLASMQQQSGVNPLFNPPWPQTINMSRQYLMKGLVPALHTKAQALLFTAVSTIAGSTALGAWFYIATAGTAGALYEGGAIAALGLVWALRRLQKKWSQERNAFVESVREDGRRVLGEVEESLRKIVREGGRAHVRPEDETAWQQAKDALERCREALDAIEKTK